MYFKLHDLHRPKRNLYAGAEKKGTAWKGTCRGREGQRLCTLRDAINMIAAWEADVQRKRLGPLRLAVSEALEGFLPPSFGVSLLQPHPNAEIATL